MAIVSENLATVRWQVLAKSLTSTAIAINADIFSIKKTVPKLHKSLWTCLTWVFLTIMIFHKVLLKSAFCELFDNAVKVKQ